MSHYQTLGVEPTASKEDIKKAYRKLAMQYHPDRTKGDKTASDKFIAITQAYDSLINGNIRDIHNKQADSGGTATPKKQELTISLCATYCFINSIHQFDGHRFEFNAGFADGDIFQYRINGSIYEFEINLKPIPGFTIDGSNLRTSMVVDEREVRNGEAFFVPNHPNPLGQLVKFKKDITAGSVLRFSEGGLPARDGSIGDLIIEVDFLPSPPSIASKLGSWLGSFTGWVIVISLFLITIGLFN